MKKEKRLRELRKYYSLTQAELAKKLNITSGYISLIETGRYPLTEELGKEICEVLGCNYEWLVSGKGEISDRPRVDKEGIADRIKMVRMERGLSQRKFAEIIGIAQPQLATMEKKKGALSKEWVRKIAEKFDVNYSWLLTGVEGEDVEYELRVISEYYKERPEERKKLFRKIREAA